MTTPTHLSRRNYSDTLDSGSELVAVTWARHVSLISRVSDEQHYLADGTPPQVDLGRTEVLWLVQQLTTWLAGNPPADGPRVYLDHQNRIALREPYDGNESPRP